MTLKWTELRQLEVPLPKADVRLVEDGYPSCVTRTGHGLQRAFILTMLQHLLSLRRRLFPLPLKAAKSRQ